MINVKNAENMINEYKNATAFSIVYFMFHHNNLMPCFYGNNDSFLVSQAVARLKTAILPLQLKHRLQHLPQKQITA